MAFGCEGANNQSETEEYSVDDAQLKDELGVIKDYATHSGEQTTTEETVIVGSEPTNDATNGQTGTSIVSSMTISRTNTDFAKTTKVTKTALA